MASSLGVVRSLVAILFLVTAVTAQFQFFEQFFGGQQQPHGAQEKQNVRSDSSWYRQNWEGGKQYKCCVDSEPCVTSNQE